MTTIELSNPTCRVQISPERGGRIVSFGSTRSGVEHVGPDHLQTWVKTGKVHDPTVGVLHLFHADLHTRTFDVEASSSAGSVTMHAEAEGIEFQKCFRLDPAAPLLTLEYEVSNRGDSSRTVQLETFFNWNFGPSVQGREVVTLIRHPGKNLRFDVKPYGTMGGDAVDVAGATLDLSDVTNHETLRISTDANWIKYSIYQMSGCWRGPYSVERTLAPGDTFRASLLLELCAGCPALAETNQPVTVSPATEHDVDLPIRSRETSFPVRIIHLWCGQRPDAFKWLVEQVLAPCGYTHVVLELATTLRLQSHPELAGDGANSPTEIRDLARFIRSLGLEVIPAHNFFGHQQSTNITRAYPELQEVPGELGVYCPTHPKTRRIVADIVRETIDIVEPRQYHIGHDEIQLYGNGQRVGVCPRCRARKPHEVFAYDVTEIHAQLKAAGVRTWMWGDMIIGPEFLGGFEANGNGIEGEIYRATDLLPRDIVIADWHYYTCEDYRSSADFMKRGFEVCPGVWWSKDGIRKYAEYARSIGGKSMMMTTWANPDLASLPVESVLYAARVLQNLSDADDPDIDEQIRRMAHQLWKKWSRWLIA